MSATIAPVTIGGMRARSHRSPASCTTTPTSARARPAMTTPPRAVGMSWVFDAAASGAMKAKELPR